MGDAMRGTATLVQKLDGFTGDARLYRLSPPLPTFDPEWDVGDPSEPAEYVVVSGTVVPYSGAETYIFAADEAGRVLTWRELNGSFRGGIDHAGALRGAGYTITEAP